MTQRAGGWSWLTPEENAAFDDMDRQREVERLEAQLRDVTAERDRLVRALAIFADEGNWQRWTTEIGADHREVEVTEWQGEQPAEPWKIASAALANSAGT